MSDLNELLERGKAATGPDREIDLAIHCALFDDDITKIATGHWHGQREWGITHGSIWNRTEFGSASIPLPRYTSSIDAITALIERELPGWSAQIYIHPDAAYATLYRLGEISHLPDGVIERRITTPYYEGQMHNGAHTALALTCAFLSAMIARAALKDGGQG